MFNLKDSKKRYFILKKKLKVKSVLNLVNCDLKRLILLVAILCSLTTGFANAEEEEYQEKQPDKEFDIHSNVNAIDITGNGDHFSVVTSSSLLWYYRENDMPEWTSPLGGKDVVISENGNFTLTCGINSVALYDNNANITKENHPIYINITLDKVTSIDISDDGKYFVAGDDAGFVYLYNQTSLLWSFKSNSSITKVSISGDGRYIAAGTDWHECMLYFFSRESNVPLWNYHAISGISILDTTHNGSYIMTNIDAERVALFSNAGDTPLWDHQTNGSLEGGEITPDGNYIAVGGGAKTVYLLSHEGQAVAEYKTQYPIWQLDMTPNGRYVAAADGWLVKENEDLVPYERSYFFSEKVKWQFSLSRTGNVQGNVAISDSGKYEIYSMGDKVYLFITEGLNNTEGGGDQSPDDGFLSEHHNLYISAGALIVILAILAARLKKRK